MVERKRDSSPSDVEHSSFEKDDTKFETAEGLVIEDPDAHLSPEEKAAIVSALQRDVEETQSD